METIKTQETWLPLFTGFYNSIFDESDYYIESEVELTDSEFKEYYPMLIKEGITQEYFKEHFWEYLDFNKGWNGSAEYICEGLESLDSADIIKSVEYEKVVSPKFYNFSTDSINCKITFDEKLLSKYLSDNLDEFTKYIRERYTSYDGFISSYSSDVNEWLDVGSWGEHQIGSLLQFVLLNQSEDAVMDLYNESNANEGFFNGVEFDRTKMIRDFKEAS